MPLSVPRRVMPLALALVLGGVAARAGEGAARPATARPPLALVTRTAVPARRSPCDRPTHSPYAYPWPIKPFRRQHPIRGNFGDPRTVTPVTFGEDVPGSPGSFAFHNGVDISAAAGTPVYPVVSGTVSAAPYPQDEVVVVTDDFRTFQYFHVTPSVRPGERVVAERTVLGTVKPEWWHVHLTEIDGFRTHNPADPGHLEPYRDHTVPVIKGLIFTSGRGTRLEAARLHGAIQIAVNASDVPPLPVFPEFWEDLPVTPALVSWRMVDARSRAVVPATVAADFRRTEPPNRNFWDVYAAGTYQNFPVFDHDYYFHRPGRYLFRLTKAPLDTRRLRNGRYVITVEAEDVCCNRASLTQRVVIANPSAVARSPAGR